MNALKSVAIVFALGVAACGQSGAADTASGEGGAEIASGAEASTSHDAQAVAAVAATDTMVIYKTPTCGCCAKWVEHVKEHGYTVVVHDIGQAELDGVKRQNGVPAGHESCHTALVGGYTLEGHVPADLVARMLAEKPRIRGLAVPGMPMGSPGMEGVMKQAYKVMAFDSAGKSTVYAER